MISKKRLYELVCDLSMEADSLWEQIEDLQKEVKALKKKPTAKKPTTKKKIKK